jgi:4-amino-4-deoxy-L-arabinose transferase-like glycosyltransferase
VRPTPRLTAVVLASGGVALYLLVGIVLAARKHLWNDELFTYYIARQQHFGDVLHVLRTGLEPLPPFFYVATRASMSVFGDGAVAVRVPELVGVLLACVCLFAVVARRSTPVHGLIAMLILLSTEALLYAPEARPYGLVLGFTAAGVLCWQLRCDGRGGLVSVVGLALALALAAASHYDGIFVVVPLAIGEAFRSNERRRLDWPVLGAFAFAFVPLLVSAPLIWDAHKRSSTFWAHPHLSAAVTFFGWLVRTPAVPPRISEAEAAIFVLGAVVLSIYALVRRAGSRAATPELIAITAFMLVPLLCAAAGVLATGAYVHRYAIAAVIAPAVLLPLALHRVSGSSRGVTWAAAALALAVFGIVATYAYRDVSVDLRDQRHVIALVARLEQRYRLPVAVSQPQTALELSRYAPRSVNRGMLNLAGPAAAERIVGSNSTEEAMLALRPLAQLDVEPFGRYVSANRPFILIWTPYFRNWVVQALRDRGRVLQRLGEDGGWTIYLVRRAN